MAAANYFVYHDPARIHALCVRATMFKHVFPKTRFFNWHARLQENSLMNFNNIPIKSKGISCRSMWTKKTFKKISIIFVWKTLSTNINFYIFCYNFIKNCLNNYIVAQIEDDTLPKRNWVQFLLSSNFQRQYRARRLPLHGAQGILKKMSTCYNKGLNVHKIYKL